jgi:uncharacterized protein (DUF1697 family)
MKYVALLRGINVGGNHKVEMSRLKKVFETFGCQDVVTYINSGNVFFYSEEPHVSLNKKIPNILEKSFGFAIPTLILKISQVRKIANAIPKNWQNDTEQKTDVAYLFKDVDNSKILNLLPVKKEWLNLKYVKGALIWNIKREDYNKSQINKLISHKLYKSMTVRNVNTAKFLAQ